MLGIICVPSYLPETAKIPCKALIFPDGRAAAAQGIKAATAPANSDRGAQKGISVGHYKGDWRNTYGLSKILVALYSKIHEARRLEPF